MKKTTSMILAVLAIMMAGCSKSDDNNMGPNVPDNQYGTITYKQSGGDATKENPAVATKGNPVNITLSQKSVYEDTDGKTFTCEPKATIKMTVNQDTVKANTLADLLEIKTNNTNGVTTNNNPSVVQQKQDFNIGDLTVSFDMSHEIYTHRNAKGKDIEMPYLRLLPAKLGKAISEEQEKAQNAKTHVAVRSIKLAPIRRGTTIKEQTFNVQVSFTVDVETVHQEKESKNTYHFETDYVGIVQTTLEYPDPTTTYNYNIIPQSGTTDQHSPFTLSDDNTQMQIEFNQTAQYAYFDVKSLETKVLTYEPKAYVEVKASKADTIWVNDVSELEKIQKSTPTITNNGDNPIDNIGQQTFEVANGQKVSIEWGYQSYKPISIEGNEVELPYLSLSEPTISDVKVAEVANGVLKGKKGRLYEVTLTIDQDLATVNVDEPKSEHLQYVVKYLAGIVVDLVDIKYRTDYQPYEPHDNIPWAYQYIAYRDSIFSDGSVRTSVTRSAKTTMDWSLDNTSYHGSFKQAVDDVRGVTVYYHQKRTDLLDEAYCNVIISRKIAVPDVSFVTLEELKPRITSPDQWESYIGYDPSNPQAGWYFKGFDYCNPARIYYKGELLAMFNITSVWYNHILYVEDGINGGQLIDFLEYQPKFDFTINVVDTTMPTGEPAKVFTHKCITTMLGKQSRYEIVDSVYQYKTPPF